MKKNILLAVGGLMLALALLLGYRGYRHYQENLRAELARQRAADARQREQEQVRQAAARTEARRLAEVQARQEAEAAKARAIRLAAEKATAERNRQVAEEESARLAAETARLQKEKAAAQAEARRQAEQRRKEAAEAERARVAALAKLHALAQEKREAADRETARQAALKAQREKEKRWQALLARLRSESPNPRVIYPPDYKPRNHYNLRSILAWDDYRQALDELEQQAPVKPADSKK